MDIKGIPLYFGDCEQTAGTLSRPLLHNQIIYRGENSLGVGVEEMLLGSGKRTAR